MVRVHRRGLLPLITVLVLLSPRAWGQSTQGSILGDITDPTGAVVPGAQVEARNESTNFTRNTVTNERGFYLIDRLEPGLYSLTIEIPGFKKIVRTGLQLVTNAQVRVNFQLEVAQSSEQVTVQEILTPVIETESAQIATLYDRNLQVHNAGSGRSLFSLITASPAGHWTGTGYGIQGSRGQHTGYSMDGIDTTHQRNGGMDSVFSVDNETASELRVSGVNNSAEYAYGGVIAQTTRSGDNTFHAEANYIHNNEILNARPTFASTRGKTRSHNYFLAGSGPVIKDRTFFYFHYENSKYPGTNAQISNVPTAAMRGEISRPSAPR